VDPASDLAVPRLRGRIHQIAFFLSVPLGVSLVIAAPTAQAKLAALVFAVSLAGVFGASAAYHLGRWSDAVRPRMRSLDHSMIFVLIAGSYTPFCLLVIKGDWGAWMLAAVWAGALAGVVLKLVALERVGKVTATLYMVLGWLAILGLPRMVAELTGLQLALLIAGGLLYTVGAIVLLRNKPNPSPRVFGYHELWHAMGVTASLCHFIAILLIVVAAR
jgi:hemolysin III